MLIARLILMHANIKGEVEIITQNSADGRLNLGFIGAESRNAFQRMAQQRITQIRSEKRKR